MAAFARGGPSPSSRADGPPQVAELGHKALQQPRAPPAAECRVPRAPSRSPPAARAAFAPGAPAKEPAARPAGSPTSLGSSRATHGGAAGGASSARSVGSGPPPSSTSVLMRPSELSVASSMTGSQGVNSSRHASVSHSPMARHERASVNVFGSVDSEATAVAGGSTDWQRAPPRSQFSGDGSSGLITASVCVRACGCASCLCCCRPRRRVNGAAGRPLGMAETLSPRHAKFMKRNSTNDSAAGVACKALGSLPWCVLPLVVVAIGVVVAVILFGAESDAIAERAAADLVEAWRGQLSSVPAILNSTAAELSGLALTAGLVTGHSGDEDPLPRELIASVDAMVYRHRELGMGMLGIAVLRLLRDDDERSAWEAAMSTRVGRDVVVIDPTDYAESAAKEDYLPVSLLRPDNLFGDAAPLGVDARVSTLSEFHADRSHAHADEFTKWASIATEPAFRTAGHYVFLLAPVFSSPFAREAAFEVGEAGMYDPAAFRVSGSSEARQAALSGYIVGAVDLNVLLERGLLSEDVAAEHQVVALVEDITGAEPVRAESSGYVVPEFGWADDVHDAVFGRNDDGTEVVPCGSGIAALVHDPSLGEPVNAENIEAATAAACDRITAVKQPRLQRVFHGGGRFWAFRVVPAGDIELGNEVEERARTVMVISVVVSSVLLALMCCLIGRIVVVLDDRHKHISARVAAEAAKATHAAVLHYTAHEIRNPLHSIMAAADLLQDSVERVSPLRADIDAVAAAAAAIKTLVDDILDLGKLQEGKVEIRRVPMRLRPVMRDLVRQMRSFASVPLNIEFGHSVPVSIVEDELRLRQIVSNALTNSAKFTDSGEIVMSVDTVKDSSGRSHIRLAVRDTGTGLGDADAERLFEPYVQGRQAGGAKGTGLGLPITRMLARALGGDVGLFDVTRGPSESHAWAFADYDLSRGVLAGSVFWLLLPLRPVLGLQLSDVEEASQPTRSPDRIASPATPLTGTLAGGSTLTGIRVVYADDESVNRRVAARMLQSIGASVDLLEDGDQVEAYLREHHPTTLDKKSAKSGAGGAGGVGESTLDAILLDVNMSRMSGTACCRHLRRKLGVTVPILAVTANASTMDAKRYKALGFSAVLAKPFGKMKLERSLAQVILGVPMPRSPAWTPAPHPFRASDEDDDGASDVTPYAASARRSRGDVEMSQKLAALAVASDRQVVISPNIGSLDYEYPRRGTV